LLSEILIILALIVANAFFAGAEIAIVASRKSRVQQLVSDGKRSARTLLSLKEHPERFLATVQVGITVVGATAAAYGGSSIAERLEPLFEKIPFLEDHAGGTALAIVVAGVSYLSIVLGELVPKSLALRASERYALIVARPLSLLAYLARPLVYLLTASSNVILRPFGDRTTFTEARLSAEELQQLVDEALKAGSLDPKAAEIASRALEFPTLLAIDVMVPRHEVAMLPRHAPPEEIRRILLEHTHNRMPVYEGRDDNIVGYVSVKDLLAVAFEQKLIVLEDVIRKPYFVPENQRAVDVLGEMRRRRIPFAIVVDEQGSMSGIITIEDLLEELVGDIFSEHAKETPEPIVIEGPGVARVLGSTPLREVDRALGVDLPEDGDYTTLAGLVLDRAGHIPVPGEVVTLEDGTQLETVEASVRRVRVVRVRKPPPPAEAA
jgi:putative hemolysin